MNPTDPDSVSPEDGTDPNTTPPDVAGPHPWDVPQQQAEEDTTPPVVDATGTGDLLGAAADTGAGALNIAGGAAEVVDAAGGALEGAGSALDVAGSCLEGCGSCSLAILLMLFVAASTALALFR